MTTKCEARRKGLQSNRASKKASNWKKRKQNFPHIKGDSERDRVQSHIWLPTSPYMTTYLCISPYCRKPFLIDFVWISLNIRIFFFLFYQCGKKKKAGRRPKCGQSMYILYDGQETALQHSRFSKLWPFERMGCPVSLPDIVLASVVDEWSVLIQKGILQTQLYKLFCHVLKDR